jgi:glycosidase
MEFHVSRQARKRYKLDDSLFSFNGNVIFANFHAARVFAQKMNEKRDLALHPELSVRAGQINAMGLIDEILHLVISLYRTQKLPTLYSDMEKSLVGKLGIRKLNAVLRAFTRDFPPQVVFLKQLSVDEYLEGETNGISNRYSAIEEILMLWLANQNSAYRPFSELFNDSIMFEKTAYADLVEALDEFFQSRPGFGPDDQSLIEMLRSPAIVVPNSLRGQLDYIRTRWAYLLGHYLLKLLGSLDLFSEEEKIRGVGPGTVRLPVFGAEGEPELERFSPDADWMPNLVLMAKNAYVWMDQLSKQYQNAIDHLDQIPDEELDLLAERGFTGLWLIGLWERSNASEQIKQLCGNPDAIASAYSLKEYRIADDLGGEEALKDLQHRCWQRGIRLASDMVPNHMAIDSNWIYDHPDWFISLPYSPFPSYTFNGPDLSHDSRGEIKIEDHYYDRTDAAVVFKYHDHQKNRTSFVYHGNDGTSMPWNDTAQLNYLDPNVREAVIRTILDVARRFPVIRFDAAMTLAKRHYQRLWYPLPGGGCDIPSRSDFGMPQESFNQRMPEEFWREVVDRVAAEAPDTLLLAEAFWLMEGYFVRTLGMHRVYNSAFMNLLRDEDNAKYRQVMKNTLEFDPEILKRYVNFMNNPDELTAVAQFGRGDKYFGICTLMATMPGLPMFGHGQIEGLSEKYGMEFKRAYWDEQPDQQLIDRHAWQIIPLLKQRYLFANVENFYLYDFYDQNGVVDENVFAYSNIVGDERSLVIYHNRFGDTYGWVRKSVGFMDKASGSIKQVDLSSGLGLTDCRNAFVIFLDRLSGMQYIRSCEEIAKKGLFIQLNAYRAYVFQDFQMVEDDEKGYWRKVHDHLGGHGTGDIHTLQTELPLRPVLQPLREIANSGYFNFLLEQKPRAFGQKPQNFLLSESDHKLNNLVNGAAALLDNSVRTEGICESFRRKMDILFSARWLDEFPTVSRSPVLQDLSEWLRQRDNVDNWLAQVCWAYLDCLRSALDMDVSRFLELAADWRLFPVIESGLWDTGALVGLPGDVIHSIIFLLKSNDWFKQSNRSTLRNLFNGWLNDDFFREFLRINTYKDQRWFGKESFELALSLMAFEGTYEILRVYNPGTKRARERLEQLAKMITKMNRSAENVGYDLEKFLRKLG